MPTMNVVSSTLTVASDEHQAAVRDQSTEIEVQRPGEEQRAQHAVEHGVVEVDRPDHLVESSAIGA